MRSFIVFVTMTLMTACGVGNSHQFSSHQDEGEDSLTSAGASLVTAHWYEPVSIYSHTSVDQDTKSGMIKAMTRWNQALGQTMLVYAGEANIDRDDTLYGSLSDDVTVIYTADHWRETTAKDSGTLATTIWEVSADDSGRITKGDIILNTEFYDFFDSEDFEHFTNKDGGVVDAETVLVHELGHLLGLGHVDDATDLDSVMSPYTEIGYGDYHRELSQGDLARIEELYDFEPK